MKILRLLALLVFCLPLRSTLSFSDVKTTSRFYELILLLLLLLLWLRLVFEDLLPSQQRSTTKEHGLACLDAQASNRLGASQSENLTGCGN
jgi:hypothetical protein